MGAYPFFISFTVFVTFISLTLFIGVVHSGFKDTQKRVTTDIEERYEYNTATASYIIHSTCKSIFIQV